MGGTRKDLIYVVPPKDLLAKEKIWRLLKSLYGTRDESQVWRKGSANWLPEKSVPCLYCGATLEALGVHCGDDFIFGIPDDWADDLE